MQDRSPSQKKHATTALVFPLYMSNADLVVVSSSRPHLIVNISTRTALTDVVPIVSPIISEDSPTLGPSSRTTHETQEEEPPFTIPSSFRMSNSPRIERRRGRTRWRPPPLDLEPTFSTPENPAPLSCRLFGPGPDTPMLPGPSAFQRSTSSPPTTLREPRYQLAREELTHRRARSHQLTEFDGDMPNDLYQLFVEATCGINDEGLEISCCSRQEGPEDGPGNLHAQGGGLHGSSQPLDHGSECIPSALLITTPSSSSNGTVSPAITPAALSAFLPEPHQPHLHTHASPCRSPSFTAEATPSLRWQETQLPFDELPDYEQSQLELWQTARREAKSRAAELERRWRKHCAEWDHS